MRYEAPSLPSHEAAETLAAEPDVDPRALGAAIIGLALADPDVAWTTSFFLRLATHAAPDARGAVVLGFGHLARRFRALPEEARVVAAIKAGLEDPDPWVRGQADAANDDVTWFLGRK